MAYGLLTTFRSMCAGVGGGRRHGMGSETRSVEHGKRVGSSRTFNITDQVALGVFPGFKQETCKVRWQQDNALGERRSREDAESVGSPTTQRNVVCVEASIVIGT